MLLHERAAQAHDMHDREDSRFVIIGLLRGHEIWKQARDRGTLTAEAARRAGREQSLYVAGDQQIVETSVVHMDSAEVRRQFQSLSVRIGMIEATKYPLHVRKLGADFMLQPAAHIDAGGLRPFRHSDPLSN